VESKQLLDEFVVVFLEGLAVLLQVEDSSRLALNFIDVGVVDPGNLVACAGSLATSAVSTLLAGLSCQLLLLLDVSELGSNAELVVTALLLPEGLKLLTSGPRKGESLTLNSNGGSR
jgi:hypothetical protein